jgi:hypothetical protein
MFKKLSETFNFIAWQIAFYAESIFWLAVAGCGIGFLIWNN